MGLEHSYQRPSNEDQQEEGDQLDSNGVTRDDEGNRRCCNGWLLERINSNRAQKIMRIRILIPVGKFYYSFTTFY